MSAKVKFFLMDEGFIDYALGVAPELVSQWEAYFRVHPEDIIDAEEAKAVLLAPADVDCGLLKDECAMLKDRIISSIF